MNNCGKCNANCCSNLPGNLYIDHKDIALFKENNILVHAKTIFESSGLYVGVLAYEGHACKYFTKKDPGKCCMVYSSRPRACRDFKPSFCGRFQSIKEDV